MGRRRLSIERRLDSAPLRDRARAATHCLLTPAQLQAPADAGKGLLAARKRSVSAMPG